MRDRIIAMVSVACVIAALAGCAHRAPASAPSDSLQSPPNGSFQSTGMTGDEHIAALVAAHPFSVRFGQNNRDFTMSAGRVIGYSMPVAISGNVITPDIQHEAVTANSCAEIGDECDEDRWIGNLIEQPLTYTLSVSGQHLTLTQGSVTVELTQG